MEDREQDVRDDRVGGLAVELEVCANPDNRIPIRIKPSAPAVHRAPPSISASNRTTRRRATGCIVRKSMMSASPDRSGRGSASGARRCECRRGDLNPYAP
jgi:hypothetical protein